MRPKPASDGVVYYKLKAVPPPSPQLKNRHKAFTEAVQSRSRPSEKQIEFALGLLQKCGYSTAKTTGEFEDFGLPFEVGTNVECWLASLSIPKIRLLIDDLKERPFEFDFWT